MLEILSTVNISTPSIGVPGMSISFLFDGFEFGFCTCHSDQILSMLA